MPPLSPSSLIHHLQDMAGDVTWVDVAALRSDRAVACVDGRNHECVAAIPGGNAGLFVVMLASLEQALPTELTEQDVSDLFVAYLDRFGQFYLHSDTHAVGQLFELLGDNPDADSLPTTLSERRAFLECPPPALRPPIADAMAEPPYIGCGHLRLIAAHPDTYEVPSRLLRPILQSFIQRLWEGDDRCEFDVLVGPHAEEAVVRMHGLDETLPPLPHPQYHRRQLFIYHPEVMRFMEREHLRFLADQDRIGPTAVAGFFQTHRRLAEVHLRTTLSLLAPDLPVFDVRWTQNGIEVLDA